MRIPTRLTRFGWWLVGLTVLAIVLRLAFALGLGKPITAPGDAAEFREVAKNLADGRGYSLEFFNEGMQPTAQHPPLFPLLLAALDVIGLGALTAQRIVLAFVASLSVPLMGVLGRRLKNPAVGLGSAAIAAVHPLWVQPSGVVMSESIYLVLIPAALYVAMRCLDEPRRRWFALLGVVIGAAVLTRSEAAALLVLLGVPTVWLATTKRRARLQAGAIMVFALLVTIGPWLIRNHQEIGAAKLSTNTGNTLIGAYCNTTFERGPYYGAYFVACPFAATGILIDSPPPDGATSWTPVALDDALTSKSVDFARANVPELPAIAAVHALRVWGFWDPPFQMEYDVLEGRDAVWQRVGWGVHYLLLLFALVWLVEVPRRERRRWTPLLAPVLLVTLIAIVFYGSTRLRVMAEPSVALAAAAGVGVVVERWKRYRDLGTVDVNDSRRVLAAAGESNRQDTVSPPLVARGQAAVAVRTTAVADQS